jgi:SAM-dependent methyltransferase
MEIAHLINISIFWSFIIILVSVFGTAIFLSVLALIRKNRVDKAISKIIPNKKYYFWEVESKAVRDYIEFDVTYDTILCFEVLEHLFNPLLFLEQLKKLLKKDGVIYLSTPYQCPQILKAIHHYHEIPTDRLMWLFDAANLKIIESGKLTIAGNWYNHISGLRPFMRYFQKTRIYKITKLYNK